MTKHRKMWATFSAHPSYNNTKDIRTLKEAPAMLAILRRVFATPGVGVYVCGEDQKRALAIIARIDGAALAKARGTD